MRPTKHSQEVFRSIYLTHFLLLSDDNVRACDVLLADARILRSFEAIQEVCAKGAVEIACEPRDDCG